VSTMLSGQCKLRRRHAHGPNALVFGEGEQNRPVALELAAEVVEGSCCVRVPAVRGVDDGRRVVVVPPVQRLPSQTLHPSTRRHLRKPPHADCAHRAPGYEMVTERQFPGFVLAFGWRSTDMASSKARASTLKQDAAELKPPVRAMVRRQARTPSSQR
jgi:hypothetical protein